jgi:ABC-type cobalt transport system substrate-binding protein
MDCAILQPEKQSRPKAIRPSKAKPKGCDSSARRAYTKGDTSMRRLAYTSFLIALVATCASAQAQQQGGGSAAQIMSSIPTNSETITHWYKQSVYDPQDNKIGEIMDMLVARDGKVTALIIGVGGFLGIGEKDVVVPFLSKLRTKITINGT